MGRCLDLVRGNELWPALASLFSKRSRPYQPTELQRRGTGGEDSVKFEVGDVML